MNTVAFCTLGCKVNQYETEAMRELFIKNGYTETDFDTVADVYVINTCSVTAMSDRKSRQMIRRAKKLNPDAFIAVCGCYSQTASSEVKDIDGVDLVLGTVHKSEIVNYIENKIKGCFVEDISRCHDFESFTIDNHSNKCRAYVKIQDGCNQFCSYCIIPYARGPIRSRPIDEIISETKSLIKRGFTEIVYVGIHVASYGLDTKDYNLGDLIVILNDIDGLKRIRLSSIEPMTLDEKFCAKIKNCDKLCDHFHLSLQSGCDETLKRMNRRYTTSEYEKIVLGLRKYFPNCAITTDIMVGFPGETDEEFKKTLEFSKKINFSQSHIFKYSRRPGTVADKMPNQISPQTKQKRSEALIKLTKECQDAFLTSFIGKEYEVLFETYENGYYVGKTTNYATVYAKGSENLIGEYRIVSCDSVKDDILYASLIN